MIMTKYVLVNTCGVWYQMANHPSDLAFIDGCHIEKWIYIERLDGSHELFKIQKLEDK